MSKPEEKIHFHPEQIKYLEKIFPESVFPHDVSEATLRHYNGQRSVLQFIRSRVRNFNVQGD